MARNRICCALGTLFTMAAIALGQDFRQPYSSQLRTDPSVGNVHGIQRHGRPLRTDPAEGGDGNPYYVFPTPGPVRVASRFTVDGSSTSAFSPAHDKIEQLENEIEIIEAQLDGAPAPEKKQELEENIQQLRQQLQEEQTRLRLGSPEQAEDKEKAASIGPQGEPIRPAAAQGATTTRSPQIRSVSATAVPRVYQPTPYNATRGMRLGATGTPVALPSVAAAQGMMAGPQAMVDAARGFVGPAITAQAELIQPYAAGFVNVMAGDPGANILQIYHQPLIQVKARVVEVVRSDALQAASVLDYIARHGTRTSLITGNNINNDRRNTTGVTRFPNPMSLLNVDSTSSGGLDNLLEGGSGGLVNITSEHMNYIARFLAGEFNADVITAPQVVTLNGQNVELTAGSKVPFQLGQNVIENGAAAIQQFFYKHVGTYISVTPRIVDWGLHAEGQGNAAIVATEITDWNRLFRFIDNEGLSGADLKNYLDAGIPVPFNLRAQALDDLNQHTRKDLLKLLHAKLQNPLLFELHQDYFAIAADFEDSTRECVCGPGSCNWKPEECTLDLEVVVRLSDAGRGITAERGSNLSSTSLGAGSEENVRAVANIVQVKSGHGVVMAGLIGEREIEELSKVPVLGDIPYAGFLFRSKSTSRQKTEVLIFIEAQVLPPHPDIARAESAHDFRLSQPHVAGELLDSPLEYGMYRAGFGTYLPPHTKDEEVFWLRLGRKVRKATTEIDDILK